MASLTSALLTCRTEKDAKADEAYFDSYGYFDIHRTMLGDEVRHHSLLCMATSQARHEKQIVCLQACAFCGQTCTDMLSQAARPLKSVRFKNLQRTAKQSRWLSLTKLEGVCRCCR